MINKNNSFAIQTIWNRKIWIEQIDQHPLRILGLISLLALILNITHLLISPPTFSKGVTSEWWELAQNIARGRGYVACYHNSYSPFCGDETNNITAAREPLPALLFAGLAVVIHEGLRSMGLLQVVLNLLILPAIFFLSREIANVKVGLLASFLWALYLPAIAVTSVLGGDLLATLGVTWGVFLFLRARKTNATRYWVAAGVCIGLGVLSRSVVLVIVPALGAGLILWPNIAMDSMRSRVASLRPLALFVIVIGLTLLPWSVRNYMAFGRLVIGSSLTGFNLYRHSYLLPTNDYLHVVCCDTAQSAKAEFFARRTDLKGTENEVQMDAVYRDEALGIIASNPFHYVVLSGWRFLPLWFNWDVKKAYGDKVALVDYFVMLEQFVLLVAAAIGLRGKLREMWPLAAGVVTLTLAYMVVDGQLRYILPAMPLTVALAMLALAHTGQKARWVTVTIIIIVLNVLLVPAGMYFNI